MKQRAQFGRYIRSPPRRQSHTIAVDGELRRGLVCVDHDFIARLHGVALAREAHLGGFSEQIGSEYGQMGLFSIGQLERLGHKEMLGGETGAQDMFAGTIELPGRAVTKGREKPVVQGKHDFVQDGALHMGRECRAILAPDIMLKSLLPVVVIPSHHRRFRGHGIHLIDGKSTKCGKQSRRGWGLGNGAPRFLSRRALCFPKTRRRLLLHGASL